jgi:acyl transferase domain-containing protein
LSVPTLLTRAHLDVIHDNERINTPEVSQPLCTVLQIALVELLRTFGLVPRAVVGHSSGEIAAAYTVGALSHEAACKVAYYRGQVAQEIRQVSVSNPGAMMSVNLAESEVLAHLRSLKPEETVHIACVNSPTNITLSGPSDAIDVLKSRFDQLGIFAQKVNTGVAYHSPAMRAASTKYLELMGELDKGSGGVQPITMISSVTGHIATSKMLAMPQYWVDNLLMPVRFADALQRIERGSESLPFSSEAGSITDLVEIGPHAALRRPVMDTIKSWRYHTILKRAHNPLRTILEALGALFCHGHPVSVLAANAQSEGTQPYLVDCPSYPFDRSRRYWAESRLSRDYRLRPSSPGYLLGERAHDWNPLRPRWRNWLCTETMPWLADHVVSITLSQLLE